MLLVDSTVSNGIRVEVEAAYLPEQSDVATDKYVFAYHVTISNESDVPVTLARRHWYITDTNGKIREVEGEGVVGKTPEIGPGESHEYTSGTVIEGPIGTMKGSYEMFRPDGTSFKADIPEFELRMPRTLH